MFSEYPIARTRTITPRWRKDLITRPRLLYQLDEIIDKKLILITAPAGYGKTSLLVDFANNTTLPVCWYTVNLQDNDPQRFVSNLISSIGIRFPKFGQRSYSALKSLKGVLDVDYIVNTIINDIYDNVLEHFILILDDYYLLNDCIQIRNLITRFIQDSDENCHIILTSRMLLSLPIITILATRSDVMGLSFEELAFREDEIQQYFHDVQKRELSEQESHEIHEKTEGWITGIILNTQLRHSPMKGLASVAHFSNTGLDSYFSEFIAQIPKDMMDALVWTSLLEEFNEDLCQQILGRALPNLEVNWADMIARIQNQNLFVLQVGEEGNWYRYHHLFSNFLKGLISKERPDETITILNCMVEYYLNQEDWDHSYSILRDMNIPDRQVELIEKAMPDMLSNGRLSTLSTWIDSLPLDILSSNPTMLSLQGFIASTTGDNKLAITLFNQAINSMVLPNDRQVLARSLVWRAGSYRMAVNFNAAIKDAQEAIRLVGNDLSMSKVKAEAFRCIGLCLDRDGKPTDALKWLDQALQVSISIDDKENSAIIQLGMGVVHEKLGNYSEAMAMYQSALAHWHKTENSIWLPNVLNNLGVLQHLTGDYKSAILTYEKGLQFAQRSKYSRIEAFILTGIGDIYIQLNALEEASDAYQQAKNIAQTLNIFVLSVYLTIQEAIIACDKGDFVSSYRLIEEARSIANKEKMTVESNICDLEYAGIKIKEGKPYEVFELLEKAHAFFESGGHKVQSDKSSLYLTVAYGQTDNHDLLYKHLIKVLACLHEAYKPTLLIATANRFFEQLSAFRNLDYIGIQVENLLSCVTEFWNDLPDLRRYIRLHAISVRFAPPVLNIRTLGKMQVKVNKKLITNSNFQTQAARDLFFMLLAHPEGISKDEIGEIFWPDATSQEIKFRIKNTVYRLRHAVGKDVIILDQDNYRFNNELDYEYDVEIFLKENALGLQSRDSLKRLTHFREAAKIYKGDFLPEIDEIWVYSVRESLQQICINILLQTAEIYLDMAEYNLALEFCQRALSIDNCLELAYRLSFRIYAAMGDRAAVVKQYSRCREALMREINAEPSPQTLTLYLDLLK